jgi:citrate lyase subunit beta/citryl-CoA lyase
VINKKVVKRSTLILPVNIPRFVEKAWLRGADAIALDLEDAVPVAEKESARKLIKDSIPLAARGGSEVWVRINNDPSLLPSDVEASVHPGLDGILIPKTESVVEVRSLEVLVEELERARGIEPGHIKFFITIESPQGVLKIQEIAVASSRIESITIGLEDYCLELGVELSTDCMEVFYPFSFMVTVCKAAGINPMGLLGSVGEFRDLEKFERAATRARQLGCVGAGCIHPDQVKVLNRVFSPGTEEVEYARRVVEAFEQGQKKGTASVNLDGKMIDTPVYRRARLVLERVELIAEVERRKTEALASLK